MTLSKTIVIGSLLGPMVRFSFFKKAGMKFTSNQKAVSHSISNLVTIVVEGISCHI